MMSYEYKISEGKLGKAYLIEGAIIMSVVVIILSVANSFPENFTHMHKYVRLFFIVAISLPPVWFFIFGIYYLLRRRGDWYICIDDNNFIWKKPNGERYVFPTEKIKYFDVVSEGHSSIPSFFLLIEANQYQYLQLSINSRVDMNRVQSELEHYGTDSRSIHLRRDNEYGDQLEKSGYTRAKSQ